MKELNDLATVKILQREYKDRPNIAGVFSKLESQLIEKIKSEVENPQPKNQGKPKKQKSFDDVNKDD